jgi:hypothetical protein
MARAPAGTGGAKNEVTYAPLVFFADHSHCVSIRESISHFHSTTAQVNASTGGLTEETTNMVDLITFVRSFGRHMALAGIAAGSTLIGMSAATAGSCPSDKMKADARQPVTYAAKGVTDTVLAAIDLEKEPAKIKERQLRFRKLTIEPGGIVPWHSHADRPAIIYIGGRDRRIRQQLLGSDRAQGG